MTEKKAAKAAPKKPAPGKPLPAHTLGDMPSPRSHANSLVVISDGNGGAPCLGFSDGNNWYRMFLGDQLAVPVAPADDAA